MLFRLLLTVNILFTLSGTLVFSQDQQSIDSLRKVIKLSSSDTTTVDALIALGDEYMDSNFDLSIAYYERALKLSRTVGFKKGEAIANNNIGYIYYYQGQYEKALGSFEEALKLQRQLKDRKEEGIVMLNIAEMYGQLGKNRKQLESLIEGVKIFEEVKDTNYIIIGYSNLGTLYYEEENYKLSQKAFEDALRLAELINNEQYAAVALNNLGSIYDLTDTDKAIEAYTRAAQIRMKLNDEIQLISSYANLGNAYMKKKKYAEAEAYFTRALNLSKELGIREEYAYCSRLMGDLSKAMNENESAITWYKTALDSALSFDERRNTALKLYQIYSKNKNYEEALKYHEVFIAMKDSLLNIETKKAMAELSTKYETEKKETENKLLKQQNDIQELELEQEKNISYRQRIIIFSSLGGGLLLIALAFLLYNRNRIKQRANEQLQAAYKIIEEKNRDITDSIEYAQRLQVAILPDHDSINNTFPENFIYFQPRDIVSGDFYFFHERDNKVFIAAADCTGHGVPGAFISMICNNLLTQSIVELKLDDPGEILTRVNGGVRNAFVKEGSRVQANDGMDTSLCVFDKTTGLLSFAGAMNSAYIISEKTLIELQADRVPIGGRTEKSYRFTTQNMNSKKGDLLYLFSDGYADQFGGPKGKKFLVKRLKELLVEISDDSMHRQMNVLHDNLLSWQGNNDRVDDVLVIGIRL